MNENNLNVKMELLKNAFEAFFSSALAFIISLIVVFYLLWDLNEKTFLIGWSLLLLALTLLRLIHSKQSFKTLCEENFQKKEFEFKFLTLLSAALYSLGIFILLPHEIVYQAFLTMILSAISTGAVLGLSFFKRLATQYIMILLLPFALAFLLEGTNLHNLIVIILVAYIIILMKFSVQHHNNIVNLIVSRIQNDESKKEMLLSKEKFSTIFKQAPIGICTYDSNLVITNSNQALAAILKVPISKLIGLDMNLIPDKSLLPSVSIILSGQRGFYEGEYQSQIMKLNLWISVQTSPIYDSENNILGGLMLLTDITQRVKADEKIRHQAFYDHLTGLVNRLTLQERLEQEIARLIRHKRFGALIFIDIDHFKTINDTLGHDIGDQLLIEFANRMKKMIRKEDTFARLGGDEFVILLSELGNSLSEATELAYKTSQKSHQLMKQSFEVKGHILNITLSQGVTMIGDEDTDIHTVLKNADIAMYEAKKAGRSNSKFFKQEMTLMIHRRLELDNDLHEAIKTKQFELFFQPIVKVQTNKIVSCEALIRWNHPTKGLVPPDEFIPFVEESGLIIPIGNWVIESACQTYLNWSEDTKKQIHHVAINISPKQFAQDDFTQNLTQTLKKYNLAPNFLKLELTESVVINNFEETVDKMKELQNLGFKIAMDDFGTGYSSLSYLKNLPFDVIKIDRTFVKNILQNKDDATLIEIIHSISKHFKFEVVAEGVEEIEQVKFLQTIGCNYYQGYLVSKPLCSQEFEKLILTWDPSI